MFDARQTKKEIIEGGMKLHALFVEAHAKIEQLQAALKPLAGIALWSDAYPDCKADHVVDQNLGRYFTVEQIKAAREARGDEQREAKEG